MLPLIFIILMTSFLMYIFILNISYISSFLSILFFTSFFFCCLSSCTWRRQFVKVLVYYCFLVFRRTDAYISQDLFYFVNLTSSCHSFLPLSCLLHNDENGQYQVQTKQDILNKGFARYQFKSRKHSILSLEDHLLANIEGRPGICGVFPLSGISGLSLDSPSLSSFLPSDVISGLFMHINVN